MGSLENKFLLIRSGKKLDYDTEKLQEGVVWKKDIRINLQEEIKESIISKLRRSPAVSTN